MPESVLSLKDFGLSEGDKIIFSSVALDVPVRGILNIIGSTAVDKSILIRTLCGIYKFNPKIKTLGEANYLGEPLGEAGYPSMMMQSIRFMNSSIQENIISNLPGRENLTLAQQRDTACRILENSGLGELTGQLDMIVLDFPLETIRHLAIIRVCAANPPVIFLDEPTLGIKKENVRKLLEYIEAESKKRAIVLTIHDQTQAKLLGGQSVLVGGRCVQEFTPTTEVFPSPKPPVNAEFTKDRFCLASSLDVKPKVVKQYKSDAVGPRGFLWLKNGEIAGMPKPGIMADLNHDLEALERVGITHLISLTAEMEPVDARKLAKYSISSSWVPIDEMDIPLMDRATLLCEEVGQLISEGHAVAVYSKAGLGRTGTVLALHLIWEGQSAYQALESVRRIEPRWVQSEEQELFLEEFSREYADENYLAVTTG